MKRIYINSKIFTGVQQNSQPQSTPQHSDVLLPLILAGLVLLWLLWRHKTRGRRWYRKMLKSDAWMEKKERILARDHHRCRWAGCRNRWWLDVHHLYRVNGAPPDQIPDSALMTLCHRHHEMVRGPVPIVSFALE